MHREAAGAKKHKTKKLTKYLEEHHSGILSTNIQQKKSQDMLQSDEI